MVLFIFSSLLYLTLSTVLHSYVRSGDFTWNDKITTPPGLYILYLLPHINLAICRGFNIVVGLLLAKVLADLHKQLHIDIELSSISPLLVLFPPSFFFHFLFYTDTFSTLLVLSTMLLAKRNQYNLAGFVGLYSLTLRQTNVVWMCFIAGTSLLDILNDKRLLVTSEDVKSNTLQTAFSVLCLFIKQSIINIRLIIGKLWSFILILFLFVGFIAWNGSITLGDKSNHKASTHLPQIFYFSAFTCFFGLFSIGNPIFIFKSILPKMVVKNWMVLAILTPCAYFAVQYYTIAHPFLLADNRHFTFYIWRHILRHESIRISLCPLYCICVMLLQRTLAHKPILWQLIFIFALSLTLIPSPLIEFRYFIIPYFIWRLNMNRITEQHSVDLRDKKLGKQSFKICASSKKAEDPAKQKSSFAPQGWIISAEVAWYLLLNGIVLTLFLYFPFVWSSSPADMQRFMW